MFKKILEYTGVTLAVVMLIGMTVFAFTGAKGAELQCITADALQTSYNEHHKANLEDKIHFYRFTGDEAQVVKGFVNSNYGAELTDLKSIVFIYNEVAQKGMVTVYAGEGMGECPIDIRQPSVESLKKVIEFLEGV